MIGHLSHTISVVTTDNELQYWPIKVLVRGNGDNHYRDLLKPKACNYKLFSFVYKKYTIMDHFH